MSDPFVHLHVASGYSLRYGASHPQTLVERAAEQEMDTLALTDRDGTYGAVKFTRACYSAGIRPVLGVELAHHPTQSVAGPVAVPARTPVRGGSYRDPVVGGLPRVTFLATADGAGWRAGRLGGAVPAGLGDPPVGGARPPRRRLRRPRRPARRAAGGRPPDGAARPVLRAGPGRDPAP